ncbi:hypothetical protein BGX21_003422, partial [Mortierella sp. AD011]
MNPFNVVSYCQSNLPTLPSLPSSLLQRRSSTNVVNVVVQTSPTTPRKHSLKQPISHAPHTPIPNVLEDKEEVPKPINTVNKPRNNPQAILPEFEKNDGDLDLRFAQGTNESENNLSDNLNRHTIHSLPISATTDNINRDDQLKRKPLQRPVSFHTVHTTPVPSERTSIDGADRAKVLKPSPSDAVQATTMISQPRPMHLRHSRSNSTPLITSSPLLKPSSKSSPSSLSTSTSNIPVSSSEVNQKDHQFEQEEPIQQQEKDEGKEEEKVKEQSNLSLPQASIAVQAETSKPLFVAAPSIPTLNAPSIVPSTRVSASQPSATEQKMSTPTPLPTVAPAPNVPVSSPAPTPSPALILPKPDAPSTPAPPSPSMASAASAASSFLSSWQGRSRTMIPTIPRPSPLMSFSAARSVVNTMTSAGTGLLPSKEQLGSLPVAGRILNHPVMDSTLTYIATKASERGISLGLNTKNLIAPEDVPYRKLNKKLVQQAMTLSVLAVQKEEQSKAIDDEAGDDAFELYLAAVNTLLHALPYETCDPLRREAFEMQLRNFIEEHLDQDMDGYVSDTGSSAKLRRRRRRRHRQHHEQATTLIQQHTSIDEQARSQHRGQQKQQRKQRREQHAKEQQALKKQQILLQQQLEKEMKSQKNSKQSKQPQPSALAHQSKG